MNTNTPKAPKAICHLCPFKDRPIARTTGPKDAEIAVVSRSPGYYEALNGKSFSGPSGRVLDHLLQLQGVDREQVLATNVVLCQSDGMEDGFGMAQECCSPRLEGEIKNVKTVIAAGVEASRALILDGNISRNRGAPHLRQTATGHRQRVIVTNNPAVVLRDDAGFPELMRDFRLAINPLPTPTLPKVRYTDDVEQAKEWVEIMLKEIDELLVKSGTFYHDTPQPLIIASDIEARGTENVKKAGLKHTAEIVCAGFSIRPERAVVFGETPCKDDSFRRNYLKRLFELPNTKYCWHNGKYDIKVLRNTGINARVDEDTMLLSWCLDERPGDPQSGAGGHSLEWLLKDELGWPKYESESVKTFKKTGELPTLQARRELYHYNGLDTAGTHSLFSHLVPRAKFDNVYDRPYRLMLIALSEALTKIELVGNLFDKEHACDILEAEVWPKLKELRDTARKFSSIPTLNLNSPKQMGELMYDSWGLSHSLSRPNIERQFKRSTDVKVREEILRGDFKCNLYRVHPETFAAFTRVYDDFKKLDKQRGNYFEGLVLRVSPDGRLYTDFKIHGTESGRLSSSNPNLQNITRPKEGLPNVRTCFIPDPGCIFISADLSQAELRTIAVLSGDEALKSIYTDTGRSLHKEVATEFYGSDYSYEQYVIAKNINFGVAYWQSAYSFSQMYHMPQEEAQAYIDLWWSRFPQVKEWTHSIEQAVLSIGELQSPFGHKRRFYVIPKDESARIHIVKEGINFLPQNIAANITLWALINIANKLDFRIAQPRITVHDSILVNCREDYVDEVATLMKAELEKAPQEVIGWTFPYLADLSTGPNWGALTEMGEILVG